MWTYVESENHAISAGPKTDAFGFGPWPGVSPQS